MSYCTGKSLLFALALSLKVSMADAFLFGLLCNIPLLGWFFQFLVPSLCEVRDEPPITTPPTTIPPTTLRPTTFRPITFQPTTLRPITFQPTTLRPTTFRPTTLRPTTLRPTTLYPIDTATPTTIPPTTVPPTTTNPYIDATEVAKLTATEGAEFDSFGISVAIHGDTLVIGANRDDTENDSNTGSAYVYTHNTGSVWTEHAKLIASDGAKMDAFGISVALYRDTLVIGAHWDDTANGDASGSAYVYTRSGTDWTEQIKLTASDGAENDSFGISEAMDGDILVIGAHYDDTENGVNSGSAYVYTRSGTVWTEQIKLTASDGAKNDWFGNSVAVDGDTLVIGAHNDDTGNGVNSDSTYVYTHSSTETLWTEQAKLTAYDGAAENRFGQSVAVNGGTIVIGAAGDDDNGENSGSAYVYTYSGSVWTEQAKLTSSDGANGDRFGSSVALDEDTIVIGASEELATDGHGSAYVYTHSGTVWTEQAKLTASDGVGYDRFGTSVAMDGGTIVIGADGDDDNGEHSGSAYIFE